VIPEDFERFVGREISLKAKRSIQGQRQFKGRLCGFDNGCVHMETKDGQKVNIPGELVEKANLVYVPKTDMAAAGD
jgi:ribosome maturation factor RimP